MSSQPTETSLQNITPPSEPSAETATPQKRRLLTLTVCGYKKPGLSEEEYEAYMKKKHWRFVKELMIKYGVIRWTHSYNTTETRAMMAELYDAQFANVADYDCFSTSVFESVEGLVNMKKDPYYQDFIKDDHEQFADTKNTRITIGWFEEYISDGKVVEET
ncbi:MAG: hypothetical protein ASARMPRED_009261 [Alectoria sarmentosa]|nr:MAG: hypothetical protein ASARMPRED_009261 [Alectoria sarmentosa]